MRDEAWGVSLQSVICEQCDWSYLLPAGLSSLRCPHCFQKQLTPLTLPTDLPPPELVIPFSLPADKLSQQLRQFSQGIPFAPRDLQPGQLEARLRRLYLPLWLVDGQVTAVWQAEAGFNYEVVNHQEIYNETSGGWKSQQYTETRLRWEPRLGRLSRSYQNISAPALEEQALVQSHLSRFELKAAQPYRAEAIEQAVVHLPSRAPDDAWPDAVPAFQSAAVEECRRACQADQFRHFRWTADYANKHWTLLLLPLFVTYYLDDDNQPQPVFIHGQFGGVTGRRRASLKRAQRWTWWIAGVALAVFGCSLLGLLATLFDRVWLGVAGLGLLVAIVIGLAALVPVVIAWWFNRANR